jgi:hypothetical protein
MSDIAAAVKISNLEAALTKTHAWYREALEEVHRYQRRAEVAEAKLARIEALLADPS